MMEYKLHNFKYVIIFSVNCQGAVSDLHKKIVAKIKERKRNAEWFHTSAPHRKTETCAVSEQELSTYLANMFYVMDTDMSGLVPVKTLVDYFINLLDMDLPRQHQWKLDELSKKLDPDNVSRMVNMEVWINASQAWINTILHQGQLVSFMQFILSSFLCRKSFLHEFWGGI